MMIADATIMATTFGFVWGEFRAIKTRIPLEQSPRNASAK
jgi:hypothetical protein